MKRSRFSDEQILAIVKEGEAGRKVADICRTQPRLLSPALLSGVIIRRIRCTPEMTGLPGPAMIVKAIRTSMDAGSQ